MKNIKFFLSLIMALSLSIFPAGQVLAEEGHEEATNIMEKQVDGYWIKLTFVDGAPKTGNNTVNVQVLDPQGQPVTNAGISIIAELYPNAPETSDHAGMNMTDDHDMDSMGKPVQTTKTNLTRIPYSTDFEAKVDLKAGYWMLNVVVGLETQMKSAMFPVDLVKTGPNWYVLSSFFGLIAGIIIIGGITKRKATQAPTPEVVV